MQVSDQLFSEDAAQRSLIVEIDVFERSLDLHLAGPAALEAIDAFEQAAGHLVRMEPEPAQLQQVCAIELVQELKRRGEAAADPGKEDAALGFRRKLLLQQATDRRFGD